MKVTRPFYLLLGWTCVVLGGIGVFLPVMPTTPFLIVAVWAFGKSSPALAARIRSHRIIGPYIRDWQDQGVIPLRAKVSAVVMMTAAALYLYFAGIVPVWLAVLTSITMLAVAAYIVSRPSSKAER
jgi:uncharacterized membrane protein YbaN (DUF454 family)